MTQKHNTQAQAPSIDQRAPAYGVSAMIESPEGRQHKGISRACCAAALVALALVGCTNSKLAPTTDATPQQQQGRLVKNQLSDIPIPSNFSVDLDQTRIYGGSESWFGQLTLTTTHSINDMFDFYKAEMPEFGWREITSIRSTDSLLSFSRAGRVATISISERTLVGALVRFWVSPEGAGVISPK